MKKNLSKLIIGTFIILITCSCSDDDELTFIKKPYTDTELKTNGYYYRESQHENGDIYYEAYFLYRDGIIRYAGYYPKSDIVSVEDNYKNSVLMNEAKNHKYLWGAFKIQTNTIIYEMWGTSEKPLSAYHWSGTILNDTTYLITNSCRVNNKECKTWNYLFHFKAFSPKPDSTNVFVK